MRNYLCAITREIKVGHALSTTQISDLDGCSHTGPPNPGDAWLTVTSVERDYDAGMVRVGFTDGSELETYSDLRVVIARP